MRCVMVVLLTVLVSHASGGQIPSALSQDPPADKAYPAARQSFQIPSHDGKLDALMYIAAGSGPRSHNDHRIALEIAFLNWLEILH
jgi:hypothetical protein